MNVTPINQKVVETSELKQIAEEIAQVSTKEILSSQQKFINFIDNGLALIKRGLENQEQSDEEIKAGVLKLFEIITQLRYYFTGEEYYLLVETEAGDTIGTSLEKLFEEDRLIIRDGKIEYNLAKMQTELKAIETYNKIYKSLTERLFPQACAHTQDPLFFYKHTKAERAISEGHFFSTNFAHYNTGKTWAHFYIENIIHQKNAVYTSQTAKFYNRGHVYEWYLEDLNNENIGASTKEVDTQVFLQRHKKDTVPFLKAGDITVNKGEKIYAVQIKRFNNQKLITYIQIRAALNKLKKLRNKKLTEEKMLDIIQKTFVNQGKNKAIEKPILEHVQKITSNLYGTWSN